MYVFAIYIAKKFLKLPNLALLIKQGSLSLFRNLVLVVFGESLIVLSESATLPPFKGQQILSTALYKARLFDSGMSLPAFLSWNSLKLHDIPVTPKMVKTIITDIDSSIAFDLDCTPQAVLILNSQFSVFMHNSRFCFPDWKSDLFFLVLRMSVRVQWLKATTLQVFYMLLVK